MCKYALFCRSNLYLFGGKINRLVDVFPYIFCRDLGQRPVVEILSFSRLSTESSLTVISRRLELRRAPSNFKVNFVKKCARGKRTVSRRSTCTCKLSAVESVVDVVNRFLEFRLNVCLLPKDQIARFHILGELLQALFWVHLDDKLPVAHNGLGCPWLENLQLIVSRFVERLILHNKSCFRIFPLIKQRTRRQMISSKRPFTSP